MCLVAVEVHPRLAKDLGVLVKICYRDEYFKLIEDLKIVKDKQNFPDILPFVGIHEDIEASK